MKEIMIRCEIKKIYHRGNNDFTIASVKIKEHPINIAIPTADTIVRGNFRAVHEQDEFELWGNWVDYGKYGYQFNFTKYKLLLPETKKGIIKYLTNNVPSIGQTVAKRIVEEYGNSSIEVLKKNPEKLMNIKGITEKKLESIKKEINQFMFFDETLYYCLKNGLSYHDSLAIMDKFGDSSINQLKKNPYKIRGINGISFIQCEKIAKNENMEHNNIVRIKEGILYLIESNINYEGNVFVEKKYILQVLSRFLKGFSIYPKDLSHFEINRALNELIKENLIVEHEYNGGLYIYLTSYFHMEKFVVNKIGKILVSKQQSINDSLLDAKIEQYEKSSKIILDKKQVLAIKMALKNNISILTGGPGTGKTQTIKAIIDVLKMINPNISIALAAPTGRASKRMTELTNLPASTIHRLIHLNPVNNEDIEPILDDYIIIDESSMIDISLFYYLMKSIQDGSRILFVGDSNQLPSVGAGLILRDLIDSKTIPTITLTEIFRQKKTSNIILNAHKIINNNSNFKEGDDFVFTVIREKLLIKKQIITQIDSLLNNGYKLDDIQILTSIKAGDLGVDELNKVIQSNFNKNPKSINYGDKQYKIGDRVIQTVNNYDLEVFNGEIGKITQVQNINDEITVEVDFDGRLVTYNNDNLMEISLAYAITIHKAQGSEFPVVIIPIHFSMSYNYYKNSIYTAITRAKDRIFIIGDKKLFVEACLKEETNSRNSLIKPKLEDLFVKSDRMVN